MEAADGIADTDDEQLIDEAILSVIEPVDIGPHHQVTIPEPLFPQEVQSFDSVFSLGGKDFPLNGSGTKRLSIGITSSDMPELKIRFKLHDLQNRRSIEFPKKGWDNIVRHKNKILAFMRNKVIGEVFASVYFCVETTMFYNRPCVQFYSVFDNPICMQDQTFETMMQLDNEVQTTCVQLRKNIKDVTKRIKLFMDVTFFQLFKSNNIENRHNLELIINGLNRSPNFINLNNSLAQTWEHLGKLTLDEQVSTSIDGQ